MSGNGHQEVDVTLKGVFFKALTTIVASAVISLGSLSVSFLGRIASDLSDLKTSFALVAAKLDEHERRFINTERRIDTQDHRIGNLEAARSATGK